jgi:hypothetical protein
MQRLKTAGLLELGHFPCWVVYGGIELLEEAYQAS